MRIEVVRGRVDAALTDELVAFWSTRGALSKEQALERAPQAVCLLRGDDGRIVGVNTVVKARVEPLGRRRFWLYRRLLDPAADDQVHHDMLSAAFDALEAEFEEQLARGGEADDPMGLCLLLDDRAFATRNDEIVWPASSMMYAGYLPDRRQVRIRYFTNAALWGRAMSHPVSGPGDDIELRIFDGERDPELADAIVDSWIRHEVMPAAEARRRVDEVFAVAVDRDGEIAGVCTVYARAPEPLHIGLWFYRAFVVPDRRAASVGVGLGLIAMETLERRFASGEDTRGSGIAMVLENRALREINPTAVWVDEPWTLAYYGEDNHGHDVRLKWFPGAKAPGPPA
jgi:hypothetical protein